MASKLRDQARTLLLNSAFFARFGDLEPPNWVKKAGPPTVQGWKYWKLPASVREAMNAQSNEFMLWVKSNHINPERYAFD
jgi:hypothetical protein